MCFIYIDLHLSVELRLANARWYRTVELLSTIMITKIIIYSKSYLCVRRIRYRRSAISTKGDHRTHRTKRKRQLRTVPYGVKQVPFKRLNGLLSATLVSSITKLVIFTKNSKNIRKNQICTYRTIQYVLTLTVKLTS